MAWINAWRDDDGTSHPEVSRARQVHRPCRPAPDAGRDREGLRGAFAPAAGAGDAFDGPAVRVERVPTLAVVIGIALAVAVALSVAVTFATAIVVAPLLWAG